MSWKKVYHSQLAQWTFDGQSLIDYGTEAFDTIDHDRLLQILYDLGFPTDAIDVVQNLYTDATTAIKTPHGMKPIQTMDRGRHPRY
jgi:hypothetical protein